MNPKIKQAKIKISHISQILKILKESIQKEQWETLPRGWTRESLLSYWNTITGGKRPGEGGVRACIRKMAGKVDDPAAFCASLADRLFGKEWRSKRGG